MQPENLPIEDFGCWLQRRIEREEELRDADLGWRFLSCPLKNIDTARTIFIGINPGGRVRDIANDGLSVEAGSAYRIESWGETFAPGESRLQKQVLSLFEMINEQPDQVLSGYLIPFRSPSIAELKDIFEMTAFGKELWAKILSRCPAKRIITMGSQATYPVSQLLNITRLEKHPSGWGNVSIRVGESDGRKLFALPHLSTFKLMSRLECVNILRSIFAQSPSTL